MKKRNSQPLLVFRQTLLEVQEMADSSNKYLLLKSCASSGTPSFATSRKIKKTATTNGPMTLRFFRLRKRGLISPAYWSVLRRTVTTSITYLNLTRLLSPFLYSKYHSGQYKGQINFSGQSGEPIICGPPPFNCI